MLTYLLQLARGWSTGTERPNGKRRAMSWTESLKRATAVAGAALVTAAVAACGSSSKKTTSGKEPSGTYVGGTGHRLNTARVARAIELRIEEVKHLHSTVHCPAEVEQRQGNTFTCIAEGTERVHGKPETYHTPFTVEQLNSRGYVYFHS
jgi:hypothetical protein